MSVLSKADNRSHVADRFASQGAWSDGAIAQRVG
jgi:hypothetical protein